MPSIVAEPIYLDGYNRSKVVCSLWFDAVIDAYVVGYVA